MTMHLAFVNDPVKSTRISNTDAVKIAGAVSRQLRLHFAPTWNRGAPGVAFVADEAHLLPGQFPLYFFDNADVAGALGYHDVTPAGLPYGRIFVETVLSNGGTLLTGSNSVSVCASHEALELAGDEFCNQYAQANDGYSYAVELGDPVENDSYVMSGTGVSVSNFVLPEYFSQTPEEGAKFDYMGRLIAPFTLTAGGYAIRMKDGKVTQIFGESYPQWKLPGKQHPVSRTARRMAGSAV
jgi:hypothetical protein